jgi:5-methylcytosine-specific restriction endonuclease McrA
MSSIRKGKNNPQWKGGLFDYYGDEWSKNRKETLERDDYKCRLCDINREEHYDKYDIDLHIHHIVPIREIVDKDNPKTEQFKSANSLQNLVTLCISCHRNLEKHNPITQEKILI